MRHAALFLAVALGGAALDLATKSLAFRHIHPGTEVVVADGILNYGRTLNTGVVGGLFAGIPQVWLIVSALAVPALFAVFIATKHRRWIGTIALGMILAGTIGNLADRVLYGGVRDFIKFHHRGWAWPTFNLADSFLCVGVFLLAIEMVFFDERKREVQPVPARSA